MVANCFSLFWLVYLYLFFFVKELFSLSYISATEKRSKSLFYLERAVSSMDLYEILQFEVPQKYSNNKIIEWLGMRWYDIVLQLYKCFFAVFCNVVKLNF